MMDDAVVLWIARVRRWDGRLAWAGWREGKDEVLFTAPWQGKLWLIDKLNDGGDATINQLLSTYRPHEIKWLKEDFQSHEQVE